MDVLKEELEKSYIRKLQEFLEAEWDHPERIVYPTAKSIFEAFHCTPFDQYVSTLENRSGFCVAECGLFCWVRIHIMNLSKQWVCVSLYQGKSRFPQVSRMYTKKSNRIWGTCPENTEISPIGQTRSVLGLTTHKTYELAIGRSIAEYHPDSAWF